jgi:hypothetical protein
LASGNGPVVAIRGGDYALTCTGTLGSVTAIKLFMSSPVPDGSMVPASNLVGTAISFTTIPNSIEPVHCPAGNVQIQLAGSGGSINAWLVGLG